jgi:uncharacterized membrane-anchored protein
MEQEKLLMVDIDSVRLEALLKKEGKTQEQFQIEVLERLSQWCEERRGRMTRCLLGIPVDYLHAVIGTKGRYDFELTDEESQLLLEWADQGWLSVDIHQLPADPGLEEMKQWLIICDAAGKGND